MASPWGFFPFAHPGVSMAWPCHRGSSTLAIFVIPADFDRRDYTPGFLAHYSDLDLDSIRNFAWHPLVPKNRDERKMLPIIQNLNTLRTVLPGKFSPTCVQVPGACREKPAHGGKEEGKEEPWDISSIYLRLSHVQSHDCTPRAEKGRWGGEQGHCGV